jgi:hypothetical protein
VEVRIRQKLRGPPTGLRGLTVVDIRTRQSSVDRRPTAVEIRIGQMSVDGNLVYAV